MALNYTPAIGYSPVAAPVPNVNYTPANQSVLGASTSAPNASFGAPATAIGSSASGGYIFPSQNTQTQSSQAPQQGNGFDMKYYPGWDPAAAMADWNATGGSKGQVSQEPNYDALRGDISSSWDQYLGSLNDQLGGLGTQRTAQEDIANSQYQQGLNTLGLQKNQGLQSLGNERTKLEQNQAKTLRDVSSNLRNSFMAGNVYLGARGAGDSSAANQYALALTKLGSQQRGDVMSQTANQTQDIAQREGNLNQIYNTEAINLEQTKNQQLSQVAQWFSQAQNQIKQMQAQGQLQKGQDLQSLSKDILNQAIAQMNQVNQEAASKRSALESWAISNAQNIQQLRGNLQGISQFTAQLPQAQQIAGTPTVDSGGNFRVATGYGNGQKRDAYGNLIG